MLGDVIKDYSTSPALLPKLLNAHAEMPKDLESGETGNKRGLLGSLGLFE